MPVENETHIAVNPAVNSAAAYSRPVSSRIAWIAALAGAATTLFDTTLVLQNPAWQLWVLLGVALAFTLAALVTIILLRRGRPQATWLLIIAGQLAFMATSFIISGLGLVSLVTILVLTFLISALCLPPGHQRPAIITAFISAALAGMVDWIHPVFQLPAPDGLMFFLPVLLTGVTLIYAVFLARTFRGLPLRAQFISAFIVVSSLSIGLVTFFSNMNTNRMLSESANASLYNAATLTAQRIDAFIQANLDAITAEAHLPALAQFLQTPPGERPNSANEAAARQTLAALAQKDPGNISSYALLDLGGNDIADTARDEIGENKGTRDYYYHVLETSQSYVSPVEISRSTNQPVIYFSAPVWGEDGSLLGILRLRYRAEVLQEFLAANNGLAGSGSYAFLVDEYNVRLVHGLAPGLQFMSIATLDADVWQHLVEARRIPTINRQEMSTNLPELALAIENAPAQPFYTGEVGEPQAGTGEDVSLERSAIVGLQSRPWRVVFAVNDAQMLAPIETQTRNNALLALLIAGGAALGGLLLAQLLARPILQLTQVARAVALGDLSAQAEVLSGSEIGALASAFNSMTNQLRMTLEGLEERVNERTHQLERRAVQLRAAAEVGSVVASERVLDELLPRITQLISERFGYYHVGIFLLDSNAEYAVLRAANSEGGQRMLGRSHRLKIGEVGIVGYAVAHKEPRLALDVGVDEVYYKNPDLPETRSELALPLVVGGQALGALDVQSSQASAFSTDVIATLQILADQVAIAIDNARLFAESQAALQAARRAYGEVSRDAWERLLHTRPDFGFLANQQDIIHPATQAWTPAMIEAAQTGRVVQSEDGSLVAPIKDRDNVLGVMRLRKPPERSWSREELELTESITQQLFLALESARLYQETQARAERERLAGEITARMRASNDPGTILQTAVSQLRQALQAQRAQVTVRPVPRSDAAVTQAAEPPESRVEEVPK